MKDMFLYKITTQKHLKFKYLHNFFNLICISNNRCPIFNVECISTHDINACVRIID